MADKQDVPNESQQLETLGNTLPTVPNEQQDITALLAPYMKELFNMGPEYQTEMNYLAPYLAPNYTGNEQQVADAAGGGGVQSLNASAPAAQSMTTAGTNLENAVTNEPKPGFGQAAHTMQQYETSLPYQQAIQAGLGYQKYLETYGGLPVNTQGWPAGIQSAYNAIAGSSGTTSGGLPTPTAAAKDATASQNASTLLNPSSAGGTNVG